MAVHRNLNINAESMEKGRGLDSSVRKVLVFVSSPGGIN